MKSHIQLDDLRPKGLDQPLHWNDWYFTVNFNHQGKDHFLVLSISEGTFMGGYSTQIGLSRDLFSPVREGDALVVESPVNHIHLANLHDEKALHFSEEKDTITVEMGEHRAVCTPGEQQIILSNETVNGSLTYTPRGPVLRWGDAPDGQCAVTEGTAVSGIESLSEVHGKMRIDGKEVNIKGRGVFEHVWIKALEFMKIRVMDWVYGNSDQMYMFICHCESISDNGTPYHFEEGTLYLVEEDDYMVAKKVTVMPETWVYLKEIRRFIPSVQNVTVMTDKGVLEMKIKASLYPQIAQGMRLEPLTMHNITGWGILFMDAPITMEGIFTYSNGKTVNLTEGKGVNEQMRLLPL